MTTLFAWFCESTPLYSTQTISFDGVGYGSHYLLNTCQPRGSEFSFARHCINFFFKTSPVLTFMHFSKIQCRIPLFIRFHAHSANVRYFWSNWAYQWNSSAVQDARGMALTVSMVWRVSVFSWQYFHKAQSGQKKENERRNHWRICWHVVNTRPVWRVFSAENSVDWRRTWYGKNHLL